MLLKSINQQIVEIGINHFSISIHLYNPAINIVSTFIRHFNFHFFISIICNREDNIYLQYSLLSHQVISMRLFFFFFSEGSFYHPTKIDPVLSHLQRQT